MYDIDKNVPIPENTRSTYPFADMKVGDSFFAPGKTSRQLQNAASHWRKHKNMKFTTLTVTEDKVEGARIWRTE